MRFSLIALGLTAATWGAPPDARACDCGNGEARLVSPPVLTDAPRNVRVMIAVDGFFLDTVAVVRLFDDAGALVEGTSGMIAGEESARHGGEALFTFAPTAPLEPQRTYRVVLETAALLDGAVVSTDGTGGVAFTTSAGVDEAPPPVPQVVLGPHAAFWGGAAECDLRSFLVSVDGIVSPGAIVLVDRDDRAQLDVDAFEGAVHTLLSVPPDPRRDFLGAGGCSGSWDEAFFGASGTFRFGALSASGVFSGWSAPVVVTLPGDVDCDGLADDADACPAEPGPSHPLGGPEAGDGCPGAGPLRSWCEEQPTDGGTETENPTGCSQTQGTPGVVLALLALLALPGAKHRPRRR